MAGMIAPRGQAVPVAGGYRLKGRWQFGSGIHHAEWVLGGGFVQGQDMPAGVRMFVLPKNQVVVHDNWQVAGLKASGSSDYSIEDVFVPEEMTISFLDTMLGNIVTGGAALRLGMPAIVTPFHAGVALGIARRALDEITRQAIEKGRGVPPSPLPTHQHFQMSLGKAELELASARALEVELSVAPVGGSLGRPRARACASRPRRAPRPPTSPRSRSESPPSPFRPRAAARSSTTIRCSAASATSTPRASTS